MKIDNPELMGTMLRERRKSLGFTMEQMADAVGVSPITIMRLELGRLGYIHERTAKALEVPKKVVKRMVMVATPVDAEGRVLPNSTLAVSPNAAMRELASPPHTAKEILSGDIQALTPAYLKRKREPRKARLEALEHEVAPKRKVPAASPLKKLFLWMAAKV